MTTTFWIAAVALTGLALAFVIFPLIFRQPERRAEDDRRQQNLLAYRGRMAELEAEHQAGIIDDDNYRQLRDELAGSLLDEVDTEAASAAAPDRRRASARVVVVASVLLIPLAAVFLYQQWGSLNDVEQWLASQDSADGSDQDRAREMALLADKLRERLVESPDNPQGWAMLGRSYMSLERHGDAAWAFEQLAQASDVTEEQAAAWGLSAQAAFYQSRGQMTEAVTRAIDKARSLDADEVNALGLLGIDAFESENFERAISYWERITEVAPNHPQLPSIRQGIAAAYERLGRDAPRSDPTAEVSDRGVTVRVTLDPAFEDEVADDTTLFIFARNPEGQGAPLAIVRLTASELPVELRLDDSRAMSPNARISDANEVMVTARLSRSGSAEPQAGDWQGSTEEAVSVTGEDDSPVNLTIDKRLR